jgi:spore coat protein U-like protein
MAFTTIPTTTASNATSSISVGCTLNDPYTVGLSAGDSGVETARYMEGKNASNKLYYALSSSSSMSPNWGITNGAQSGTGAGTSSPTVFQVYGQITAAQAAAAAVDNYTDTITVTVTY